MTAPLDPMFNKDLLTVHDLARLFQVCQRTIWRWVKLGLLPQPVRYSRQCVRWSAAVVRAYLHTRPDKRRRKSG